MFLNEQVSATLNDFLGKRQEEVHEDILLSHRISREAESQPVHSVVSESSEDKYIRIAVEYEIINRLAEAELNLQNLLLSSPANESYVALFVSFCLRHKRFDAAECQLERLLKAGDNSLENRTLVAILLLRRGRFKESIKLILEMLEDSRATCQQKVVYHQLAALVREREDDKKQAEKHRTMAEKLYKVKLGLPVKLD